MKFVKKLTALFLAIVMTMAMGITVFAEGETTTHTYATKTITIENPVEYHNYKVYQILKGDLNNDFKDGSGTLTNLTAGTALKANGKTVEAIAEELAGKKSDEIGDAAYAYVDTAKAPTTTLNTTNKSATVETGYYVIVDEYTGSTDEKNVVYSRYVVAVVGDTKIAPKTSTPEVDKNIIDDKKDDNTTDDPNKALDYDNDKKGGKTDTAAIGDEIKFEITGTVPDTTGYKYYYYVLNDTLSEGLTFQNDIKVYIASATKDADGKITGYGTETEIKAENDNGYYVYTGTQADGKTFQVAFKDLKSLQATYGVDAKIYVRYTAKVNEKANIGSSANTNKVDLTYSNKPGESDKKDKEGEPGKPDSSVPKGTTPEKETKTYVTELKLEKVDATEKTFVDALKGAEFTLTGDNLNQIKFTTGTYFEKVAAGSGDYYKLKSGEYTTTAPTEETEETESNADLYETTTKDYVAKTLATVTTEGTDAYSVKATVDPTTGVITFTGLNVGTYTLTETKTPDGYSTVDPITFTITASQSGATSEVGGTVTFSEPTTEGYTSVLTKSTTKANTFEIKVENKKGSVLPSTGGMGTAVIYVAGIAMIVAAGVVVIARKRMA